jgi:ATP-binding cassette subfamily B protein
VTALALSGRAIDAIQAASRIASPLSDATRHIALLALAILAVAVVRSILNYRYAVASSQLLQGRIVVDLRHRVYQRLQRLPSTFYAQNLTGSLISRVTGDVQAVRLFIDGVVLQLVILLLALGFYLAYMFTIDVRLTLLCLATTPGLWLMSTLFSRSVRPAYAKNRELVDRMLLVLTENVLGVQVMKALARQDAERTKFAAANQAVHDHKRTIFHRVSLFSPGVEMLLAVNQAVLLGYGGYLVIEGRLALGAGLVVFFGLLQQFSAQITKVTAIINSVQESLAAAERVFAVLDAPVEVRDRPGARRMPRCRGLIELAGVSFGYGERKAVLREINLRIEPGECVAIFGPTGAGKTSLLKLIPRLHEATAGQVLVDGVDVRQWRLAELRHSVGIVFQEPFLFSDTVAANIACRRLASDDPRIARAAAVAAADEFIERLPLGYDTLLRERGKDLSGGQRQRLSIARALVFEPPVLLLDDPTSAVDSETEQQILGRLRRTMAGQTLLLVSHRPSTLAWADRVVVLDRGRIVEIGSHQQLSGAGGVYQRAIDRSAQAERSDRLIAA